MDEKKIEREIFLHGIVSKLRENPRWVPAAFMAVSEGSAAAMQTLNDQYTEKDAAFLAAIALLDTKHLTEETKEMLNGVIQRGIDPEYASEAEKRRLAAE